MEPLGAPCERIGDGALNKDVSNMAEMITAGVIACLFFISIKECRILVRKVRGGIFLGSLS